MSEERNKEAQSINSNAQKGVSPLAWIIAPFRFLGSLTFGIVLLTVILVLIALGTFIESEYGSAVSKFFLYDNPWFHYLIALLALNIAVSVFLRFPWKRTHLPFLASHVGIIILLFGCYLTWEYGEEAQITLPEGTVGRIAIKPNQQQFEFQQISHTAANTPERILVPFQPGPFSWQDYQREHWFRVNRPYRTFLWYALPFISRDTGENAVAGLSDVRFQILDYLAHSTVEPVPSFNMNILWHKTVRTETASGEIVEVPRNWEPVSLDLQRMDFRHRQRERQTPPIGITDIRGESVAMQHGERITYNLALSQEELTAFRESRPKGGVGSWGEVVLYYGGKHYSICVRELDEYEGDRFTVGDSGLQIGNVDFVRRGFLIRFSVFLPNGTMEMMTLYPFNPALNVHARLLGVFGSYWLDPQRVMRENIEYADHPMLRQLGTERIDFMQSPDGTLYYRLWQNGRIVADGTVPEREGQRRPEIRIAQQTPDGERVMAEVIIDRFIPQDVPGGRIVPLPQPTDRLQHSERRVKLRVMLDGNEDTFWLRTAAPTLVPLPPEHDQIRFVYGRNRTVTVQANFETIDLGFGILLKQSVKRDEPGTRMRAHSSSIVDFVQPKTPTPAGMMPSWNLDNYEVLPGGENIHISLNRPAFMRGTQQEGRQRGYRIYHSTSLDPFFADQPQFHGFYDGSIFPWETRPRESITMSTLSANHDPGRGWKYFGSFLLVLGAVMFLWKRGNGDGRQQTADGSRR